MTKEDIKNLMDRIPNLCDEGIVSPYRRDEAKFLLDRETLLNSEEDCNRTYQWVVTLQKIKTYNSMSSYYLKHIAEREIGYITNGVFITAALYAGFDYKSSSNPTSPNVHFNISKKSIKDKETASRDPH